MDIIIPLISRPLFIKDDPKYYYETQERNSENKNSIKYPTNNLYYNNKQIRVKNMVEIKIEVSEQMAFIIKNHINVTSDDQDWIEHAILYSLKVWSDLEKDATLQDVFNYYKENI